MKPAVVFKRDLSITTFKFLITGCKFLVATLMRADKKMLIFNFYFLTVCVSTERIKILAFFCFNWVWPSRLSVITHWRNEKKRESPRLCVAEWNFHFASRYVARCTLTIELSVTLVVFFCLIFPLLSSVHGSNEDERRTTSQNETFFIGCGSCYRKGWSASVENHRCARTSL